MEGMAKLPYLQKHPRTGMYWFRGLVPKELQGVLGRKEIIESLRTKDASEVPARYADARKRFEDKLALARSGDWPGVSLDAIEIVAHHWARWHWETNPEVDPLGSNRGLGLGSECELVESLKTYLASRDIRLGDQAFQILVGCATAEHHEMYGGWAPDVDQLVRRRLRDTCVAVAPNAGQQQSATEVSPQRLQSFKEKAARPFTSFLDEFLRARGHLDADGNYTSSGKGYKKTFERLAKLVGEKPIADIDTYDIESFYQKLLVTSSDKGNGALAYDSVNRSISNIRVFFTWAYARHLIDENPARKVTVERTAFATANQKGDRVYSIDDLKRIFNVPLYTGCLDEHRIYEPGSRILRGDHRYWFPLVGLYTGMRLSEIAQLEFDDLIVLNGRVHFSVNPVSKNGNKKNLKTASAVRQVPMHNDLEDLGFLDWVEGRKLLSKDGRIFLGFNYSKWWNAVFLVNIKMKTRTKVFHSFRHTFADALRAATDNAETRDRLMGHFRQGTGALYGSRDLLPHESDVIDSVAFPGLDLKHLR
ncbi:hypothetical protein D3869_13645 [Azospirillum brasilense]|uniref:Site-specific integrase n=1 Tax=Azospirillum brasilense TaxID=192 RepID=A0A4D8QYV1_AZOBR|nr:site-specific integrase [Azospirillum brasilense]QCO16188.1 hypothetical protein D3869_13645 [Azospirillum brasilense]